MLELPAETFDASTPTIGCATSDTGRGGAAPGERSAPAAALSSRNNSPSTNTAIAAGRTVGR